jgi:hypothetical protein
MAFVDDVKVIYEHLTTQALPGAAQATVTYGIIQQHTGVPMGEYGGYIGRVLGEISRLCAGRGLPPLTSIVINDAEQIPGSGYFVELAQMLAQGNLGGWRIDPGIERWGLKPPPKGFDKDLERWNYRPMIAENQQSVWSHSSWPGSL